MTPSTRSIIEMLPEECLMAIVEALDRSPDSLYSLLSTCRTFFRLGIAVLYRCPFDHIYREGPFNTFKDQELTSRQRDLLRLLLSCVDDATLSSLPPYQSNLISLPKPPIVDYLALYSHHDSRSIDLAIMATSGGLRSSFSSETKGALHVALLSHTPSQIRTLEFSMRHIATLQPLATKLSALTRIELYLTGTAFVDTKAKASIENATLFIQAHRRAFPSTLQEIQLQVPRHGHSEFSSGLVLLLQAMEKPRLIDVRSWSNAVHYLAQFPAEECRALLTRLEGSNSTRVSAPPSEQDSQTPALSTSEALAKFTKLESLRIRVTEPDFFAWARKSHTSIAQGHTSHPTRSLRHVHLDGFDHNLIPSLVDLTRNFDSTLETLVVKSQFDSHSTQSTTTIVTKSLAWDRMLPSLRVIDLEGSIAVRFDYSCLQYCPNVTHLNFNIGRKIPADWNPLQDALLHIVQVPRLRALELAGYWDLTDEMLAETLVPALADKLQRLNLMWCRGPTAASIEVIMRGIRSLKWLGLSPDIGLPRDEILSMKQVFGRGDLELDIIATFGSQ